MATGLYIFSVALSLLALAGWYRFAAKPWLTQLMRAMLALGLLLMGGSSFFLGVSFEVQLQFLWYDLILVGLSGVFSAILSGRPGLLSATMTGLLMLIFPLHRKLIWMLPSESLDPSGELLVAVQDGKWTEALQSACARWNIQASPAFLMASPETTHLDDYWVLDIPDGQLDRLERIVEELSGLPGVGWIEPNEVMALDQMEGTLLKRNSQIGVNDPGITHLWGFDLMQMRQLYQLLATRKLQVNQKALIAILDSGVDANHEDIQKNYLSVKTDYDQDPLGHGTHCAGIAAAVSNNGKGIASFSLDNDFVQVTSIKVLGASGSGTQRGIIQGMIEAADRGAAVISMSLGGRSSQTKQQAYRDAVDYAAQKGAIVVAAAGNAGQNARSYAPVNTPGVIGVAALDTTGKKANFSNTVQDIPMAVAAPGVSIYSTIPGDQYASFNGTSMATPHVAGLIGLLKSLDPGLKTNEAFELLHQSGLEGSDGKLTGNSIIPHRAVEMLLDRRAKVSAIE